MPMFFGASDLLPQVPDRATIILLIYKQIKRSVEPLQLLKWKKQGCPIRDSLHIIPLSGASPILLEIHSLKTQAHELQHPLHLITRENWVLPQTVCHAIQKNRIKEDSCTRYNMLLLRCGYSVARCGQ